MSRKPLFPACLLLLALAMSAAPALAGANDGTLVILNKSDHTASLLDRATGEELAVLPTDPAPHEAAVSPDGAMAVVANYGTREKPGSTLTVIDVASARVIGTIALRYGSETFERPHGLKFTPGGKRLAVTAEANEAVLVVDMAKGAVVNVLRTGRKISHMLDLDPEGRRAFVTSIGSGTLTVVDINSGEKLADLKTGEGAEGVGVTPDGSEVWVTNRGADTVTVLDAQTFDVLATLQSASFPIRVAFTPDGKHALVSCARTGDVAVFDAESRNLVRRVSMEVQAGEQAKDRLFGDRFKDSPVPIGILIPPDGRHAYVANTNADIVTVIDLETWKIAGRLTAGREPDGMAFSPLRPTTSK
jgi:YVTN family beta-propeller protein